MQGRGEGFHKTKMRGIDTAKASVVGQKHKKERFYLISFKKINDKNTIEKYLLLNLFKNENKNYLHPGHRVSELCEQ